jgi:hypothetical protein
MNSFEPILLAARRLSQVDYLLGPKPAQENADDIDNAEQSERSFKLVCSPRLGDAGAGTFQVATGASSWPATKSRNNWESGGMLLPGFQRDIGKIPEVKFFLPSWYDILQSCYQSMII